MTISNPLRHTFSLTIVARLTAVLAIGSMTGCTADGDIDWGLLGAWNNVGANAIEEKNPEGAAKMRRDSELYLNLYRSQQIGKRD